MDIYEQLYQAVVSPSVQPARRTFGTVEYVFIPVSVAEAILEDQLYGVEEAEDQAEETDVEVAGPSPVEDEVLATVEPVAEESFEPPTGRGDTEQLVVGEDGLTLTADDEADESEEG